MNYSRDAEKMKKISKNLLFFSACLLMEMPANSQQNHIHRFSCEGSYGPPDFKLEKITFNLTLNTLTGEMYHFPNRLALSCMNAGSKEVTVKHRKTDYLFIMDCNYNNSSWSSYDSLQFNRYTAKLNTIYWELSDGKTKDSRGEFINPHLL